MLLLSHHRSRIPRSQTSCQSSAFLMASCSCISLRPHLTLHLRKQRKTRLSVSTASRSLHKIQAEVKDQQKTAADCKGPAPGAVSSGSKNRDRSWAGWHHVWAPHSSSSDRGPDWWDCLLSTNTTSACLPCMSA